MIAINAIPPRVPKMAPQTIAAVLRFGGTKPEEDEEKEGKGAPLSSSMRRVKKPSFIENFAVEETKMMYFFPFSVGILILPRGEQSPMRW